MERSEFGGAKRGIKILRAIDRGIGLMVWWCFGPRLSVVAQNGWGQGGCAGERSSSDIESKMWSATILTALLNPMQEILRGCRVPS